MTNVQRADSELIILKAIKEAEPVPDMADLLVLKSKTDKGAAFTSEAVTFLRSLQQQNPAIFESLRARLKGEGVRVTELDKLISVGVEQDRGSAKPRGLMFEDIKPADGFVNGAELLDDMVSILKRFLVLPAFSAEAIALWVLFAHSHNCWPISPRLAFNSPEKRCGKTTALAIVQGLVPRPLSAANITAAAVFRAIEKYQPTLLIDEADTFLAVQDELRGVLNSGHNRTSANVIRVTGEDHEPAVFSTWAPVAIAMIGKLPGTLEDRSVVVPLKRKSPIEKVERLRLDRIGNLLHPLKARIARWVLDNHTRLLEWNGNVPHALHDRAADNWRPLVAIADVAGKGWGDRARSAAVALTSRNEDQSAAVQLLEDIREMFSHLGVERLKSNDIVEELVAMEDRPWADWFKGKPLTANHLSRLLKPFGIAPAGIRFQNGGVAKGYYLGDFEDVFTRYLPAAALTPEQANEISSLEVTKAVTTEKAVTVEKPLKPLTNHDCNGVTGAEADNDTRQGSPSAKVHPVEGKRIRKCL